MGRTIVVGDIHGCLVEFDELMRQVEYTRGRDRLVLLGDLMDRGPDPVGVVRRAQEIGAESVLGNHDETHLRWRKNEVRRRDMGKKNPMKPMTQERQDQNSSLSDEDVSWLTALPRMIRLPNNWVCVHGGFHPNAIVDEQDPSEIIRMRYLKKENGEPAPLLGEDLMEPPGSIFWALKWNGPENVLYGHAVQGDTPFHTKVRPIPPFELFRDAYPEYVQTVGLDTGCCFGGLLTALVTTNDFGSWEYSQVQAKQVYSVPKAGLKTCNWR